MPHRLACPAGCGRTLSPAPGRDLCARCRATRTRAARPPDCLTPLPPAELARRIRLYTARAAKGLPLFGGGLT